LWKVGWAVFKDNLVIGIGQGNFPYRFSEYEKASGFRQGLHGRSMAGIVAHSVYFTLMPELGLIGTFMFLGMLYYLFRNLAWIRRTALKTAEGTQKINTIMYLTYGMGGSLLGFLVSGIFISILYYPNFWLLTAFIVALKRAIRLESEATVNSETSLLHVKKIGTLTSPYAYRQHQG